jgi:pimeloyl-ACP methyl ester carboxylesterase
VVLLPGFGMDPSSFAFQTPALAQRFGVVAVSPRGVGLSDAPELPAYPVETAARDVAALLEAPAHVVGASLGAAVALELALLAPGKVRSLALVTPFVTASARLLAVTDAWCRVAAEAGAETLARTLLPWLFSERFLADAPLRERTLRGLAASVAHVSAPTLARTAEGLRAWSGTRGDDLGRIACPTLVLAGGADLLTPDAEALADRIPGARCVTVPGAGHALAVEAADAVNDALRDHLGARAAG